MRVFLGLAAVALLAGCVTPRAAPPPPPPRPAPPAPPPPPPAAPVSDDWRDVPLTPGGWRYAAEQGGTVARFGAGSTAELTLRCDLATRTVILSRQTGSAAEASLVDVTTSAGRQSFRGVRAPDGSAVAVSFQARDGFLDKMAFSRGRFIVAVTGMARLAIPAWPEFARVVEDCRG